MNTVAVIKFRTKNGEINVIPESVISAQRISGGTLLTMDGGDSVTVIEPLDAVIAKIEQATGD